jgi:hypothetical protein
VRHAIGRKQRELVRAGKIDQRRVDTAFSATVVALEFDKHARRPESDQKLVQHFGGPWEIRNPKSETRRKPEVRSRKGAARGHGRISSFGVWISFGLRAAGFGLERSDYRSFLIPGQRHQSLRKLRQLVPAHNPFAFGRAQMRPGEQFTQVLITRSVFHQHRQHGTIFHRQFGAVNWPQPDFSRRAEKTRRAIDSHAIAQRQLRQPPFRRAYREPFRRGAPAQKAEGAAGVKFDVSRLAHESSQ